MDKTIKGNLCKGLRACGIPQKQTHQILNEVEKWVDSNGPDWTVSRIKAFRQWYETSLAGDPKPAEWCRHSKTGMPTGIWGWVFKLPVAKALGVLSLSTVFYEKTLSDSQKKKFLHGLNGNMTQSMATLKGLVSESRISHPITVRNLPERMPEIPPILPFDMNGSVPFNKGHSVVRPEGNLVDALEAVRLSWEDIPEATMEFLWDEGMLGLIPPHIIGNDYMLELNRFQSRTVGRIGILQQPELKARIVANPNRVTQVTLDPLKSIYMKCARALPTDVTFRQDEGVAWCQRQLAKGVTLAGSDLTSASDLLDLECSLYLVDQIFGFSQIEGYQDHVSYFKEISRGDWFCPSLNVYVSWNQGNPLGTGPSFGLLTLTNNAAALLALAVSKRRGVIDKSTKAVDAFRVVGDDIVMLAEIQPAYTEIIGALGGEVNLSKTLMSNRVAEFAGRVITPNASYLKRVKYSEPSDNSFMSYMSQLGSQAQYFLRPRQRRAWKHFAEVPGIVVDGPWMRDSYGIPLRERYQWYLEEVLPSLTREEPDLIPQSVSYALLQAQLASEEAGRSIEREDYVPSFDDRDYQSLQVTPQFRSGGDPRLVKGQDLVKVLNTLIDKGDVMSFTEWRKATHQTVSPEEEEIEDETPNRSQTLDLSDSIDR
jgi:hypothetical protein